MADQIPAQESRFPIPGSPDPQMGKTGYILPRDMAAENRRLREALVDIESIAGNTGIGAPAACMRVADIAKRALDRV